MLGTGAINLHVQMRKHVLVLDKVSLELFWAEWIL